MGTDFGVITVTLGAQRGVGTTVTGVGVDIISAIIDKIWARLHPMWKPVTLTS